jgi:hypothetical protein
MKLRKRWVEEGACGWVIWRRNFFGFKNVHEIWGHYYSCLLTIVVGDLIPLNGPEAGTDANVVFWLRAFLTVVLFTMSFVVQFREMLPALPMSRARGFGITAFVSTGVLLYSYSSSAFMGFPVPFHMVTGAPVWTTLLLGSFAVCWRRHIQGNDAVVNGLKMFAVQMSMVVIYPFYNYIFTTLPAVDQAFFSLVLLLIKLAIKNGITYYVRSHTDMLPEIVTLNVDVFNALFVSFTMQNSSSKLTIFAIMTVDFVRMASSLREVVLHLKELETIQKQIDALDTRVVAPLQSPLSRASTIVSRHESFHGSQQVSMITPLGFQTRRTACLIRSSKVSPQKVPTPQSSSTPGKKNVTSTDRRSQ